MRQANHQQRLKVAEDLFLKAMATIVVIVGVVALALALSDDPAPTAKPSANRPPGTSEPRTLDRDPPLQLGPVPTTSTTGPLPTTGPTPEEILRFTVAANEAKARADAALAKFLLGLKAATPAPTPAATPTTRSQPPPTSPTTRATTTTTQPPDTTTTTTTLPPETTTTTTRKHGH